MSPFDVLTPEESEARAPGSGGVPSWGRVQRWNRARRRARAVLAHYAPAIAVGAIAIAWFAASFVAMIWVWGWDPLLFPTVDESTNRLAASLINATGRPFLPLPFPDPEDLAHPRHWISLGDHAVPAYSPLSLYFYALFAHFGGAGSALLVAVQASGVGAFAAATALLLPPRRSWLGLLAPLVALSPLFWLLRPWINISIFLTCLCWACLFWALFRKTARDVWLAASLLSVGLAAALRPDYAPYLFPATLLVAAAASPLKLTRIWILIGIAGAAAVAVNLLLNQIVTGNPLQAGYQILSDRADGDSRSLFARLFMPMGLPVRRQMAEFLVKYWLDMGSIAALLAAQLALLPLLARASPQSRWLYAGALAVVVVFMISRMHADLFGADNDATAVHHSIPRYWAPVYLFAVLPPLLLLGSVRSRWLFGFGAALFGAVAAFNAYDLYQRQPASLVELRQFGAENTRRMRALARRIRGKAVVYSRFSDRLLWSRWHVGILDEPAPTAASMRRALDAKLPVFVLEPKFPRRYGRALERALAEKDLVLVHRDKRHGLYRVQRKP